MRRIVMIAVVLSVVAGHTVKAQKAEVDPQKSSVKWKGKKIGSEHFGFIQLKSGYLELQDDMITGGTFVVDMSTIQNSDIENETYNQKLVGHLKSDDFFSVEKYPEATLVITGSSSVKSGQAKVKGKITIKGKTEPISFMADVHNNEYKATLSVDRSKFDVRFGSNSFFDNLGDKAIDDVFTLDVKLALN